MKNKFVVEIFSVTEITPEKLEQKLNYDMVLSPRFYCKVTEYEQYKKDNDNNEKV